METPSTIVDIFWLFFGITAEYSNLTFNFVYSSTIVTMFRVLSGILRVSTFLVTVTCFS